MWRDAVRWRMSCVHVPGIQAEPELPSSDAKAFTLSCSSLPRSLHPITSLSQLNHLQLELATRRLNMSEIFLSTLRLRVSLRLFGERLSELWASEPTAKWRPVQSSWQAQALE